jgi:hypothetical protein
MILPHYYSFNPEVVENYKTELRTNSLTYKKHELSTILIKLNELEFKILKREELPDFIFLKENQAALNLWKLLMRLSEFLLSKDFLKEYCNYNHRTQRFAISSDFKKLLSRTNLHYTVKSSLQARLISFQECILKGRKYGLPNSGLYELRFEELYIDITFYVGQILLPEDEIYQVINMKNKINNF